MAMEINLANHGYFNVFKFLPVRAYPSVQLKIGQNDFELNFVHACQISEKILKDFIKTNKIDKSYNFKCDINDEKTQKILQNFIDGSEHLSGITQSILQDLYRIGCAIGNRELRMLYLEKCIPNEITLQNVLEFNEHAQFLQSEDSIFEKFAKFVVEHLNEIDIDVLCKIAASHGYNFFEYILEKSSCNEKKNNFIVTMIEKDIKYSRFVDKIEISSNNLNYIKRISTVIQNSHDNDCEKQFLISFILNCTEFLINACIEQQKQIDSLNTTNAEQQKQIDSLNGTNAINQRQLLVSNKDNVNTIYSILNEACSLNDELLFRYAAKEKLLNARNESGQALIHLAIKSNNLNLIAMLCKFDSNQVSKQYQKIHFCHVKLPS